MKAFVTSIGESTTEICVWSLERQGFDVELVKGNDRLSDKLEYIYNATDDDFLRVDADVIVTRKVKLLEVPPGAWWAQAQCFGWYSQDVIYGGVQLIKKECLPALRKHIVNHLTDERPETSMSRLEEFYNPRRFVSVDLICGIHGYKNDVDRAKTTKDRRGQFDFDFELARKLNEF